MEEGKDGRLAKSGVRMNIPAITMEQMAEVDRLMIDEYGIQLIQMMENAGRNLAELARQMLSGNVSGRNIAVLCGAGNNGGGGMVAARHLHNWGASLWVHLTSEEARLKDIPAHQWQILKSMQVISSDQTTEIPQRPNLVIDAIIGYGLQGNPRGAAAEWIEWANNQNAPILALDTPSGLDTTTGKPGTPVIRATHTLTLALPKTGLLNPDAKSYVGNLYLADISVPPELYQRLGVEVGAVFTRATIVEIR
jgi:NAD(P)H-hydrate epimerase